MHSQVHQHFQSEWLSYNINQLCSSACNSKSAQDMVNDTKSLIIYVLPVPVHSLPQTWTYLKMLSYNSAIIIPAREFKPEKHNYPDLQLDQTMQT